MELKYRIVETKKKPDGDYVTDFIWYDEGGGPIRDVAEANCPTCGAPMKGESTTEVPDCIDWWWTKDSGGERATIGGYRGGMPTEKQINQALEDKLTYLKKEVLPLPGTGLSIA